MESGKAKDGMFKKKDSRVRIGIAVGALLVVAAVIIVIVVVVVNNNKDDSSDAISQEQDQVYDWAKILSIESSGLQDNHVNVTVRYQGNENCYLEWFLGQYLSNSQLRKAGTKQKIEDRVIETTLRVDTRQIRFMYLRIYCKEFSTMLEFDQVELENTTRVQNNIPDVSNYTFTLTNIVNDQATGNIKLNLTMNNAVNVTDGTVDFGMYLDGLNTSATPNTVFEHVYLPTGDENALLEINELPLLDGKPRGEIVVSSQLAKFGGLFTPSVRKTIASGFVRGIDQGVNILLKSTETGEVVPPNTFGILRTDSEVDSLDIFSDEYSFFCFVMGNPVPGVEVFVTYQNGTQSGLQPVTLSDNSYTFYSYITINKDQFPNGGKFACRATRNQETQTKEVTFLFRNAERCVINRTRTGVIGQTNESDIVRCAAFGIPLPNVALALYSEYGPDLVRTGKFQVSNTTSEQTLSVNLTISPPNPDIHTLVCECRQSIFFGPNQNGTQEIILYPGRDDNYTLYNELFNYVSSWT